MAATERRKHPRVETDNLVSYVYIDDKDAPLKKGMGQAINISQGGILVEAHDAFEWEDMLLLSIHIDDEIVGVKGKVVYCNAQDSGRFRIGIQFLEANEKILSFVISLVKMYL